MSDDKTITEVNVLEQPGLYGLVARRARMTYFIDTRHEIPRVLRTTFGAEEAWDLDDDVWRALVLLESLPVREAPDGRRLYRDEIDPTDRRRWMLRVGRRHVVTWYSTSQTNDVEQLESVPPVLASFNTAADVHRPLDRIDVLEALPANAEALRLARAGRPWSSEDE